MSIRMVLSTTDKEWDKYLNLLPKEKQDIYYSRSFYELAENQGNGKAQLFVYQNQTGNIGVYPFLLNEIPVHGEKTKYYDIETAYGYGGPITNNEDEAFHLEFEEAFLEYCQKENIIAEFVRFHPLMKNEAIFKKNMVVEHNRITVWLNLEQDIETIWKEDISTKNRNVIRSCQKRELMVNESQDYEIFKAIYDSTMNKVGASSFYYFLREYYESLKKDEHYVLFNVSDGDEIIASAIFMQYGEYFHYHLAGSKQEKLHLSPNNYMLWNAILYAKEHGYKKMHLGGGLSDSKEDNLFRFKKKFSKDVADFYIGKRIHNKEIYERLISDWEKEHKQKAKLFLQYKIK